MKFLPFFLSSPVEERWPRLARSPHVLLGGLLFGSGPLAAHHGQDFLVTLDALPVETGTWFSLSRGEFSTGLGSDEFSLAQTILTGLPGGFTVGATFYGQNDGRDFSDNGTSITPTLQWSPSWAKVGDFSFSLAGGWEFPLRDLDHQHDHSVGAIPVSDCSSLVGIPFLHQACLAANAGAQNHTHADDGGHSHRGIHRHGESHGFLRFIGEWSPSPKDKIAANFVAVFPEEDSPAYGYALAYRHELLHWFSLGIEATGDFFNNGEHLGLLTATFRPTHHHTVLFGGGTGFTKDSPNLSLIASFNWRF